jgi:hypothetical protein
MPAGCRERVLESASVCVLGINRDPAAAVGVGMGEAVGVGLWEEGAEAVQGFDEAVRVPCTPVRSMLTAP